MFQNVSVKKKPNIFYDGRVISWTIILSEDSRKSLGVMLPGEYEFEPPTDEIMEFISGELDILLPGSKWTAVNNNDKFFISAQTSFKVNIRTLTEYCCHKC